MTKFRGGEPVVQAVAGVADPETGRPVTPDTPFYNFSIVKAAAPFPSAWRYDPPSGHGGVRP